MMYNFDEMIDRKHTNCFKWDILERDGKDSEGVIPMWVADMDFSVAPAITEEMQKVVDRQIYGYQFTSERYLDAIVSWMHRRHHYDIRKEWICHTPNVVAGLCAAIQAVSEPGDEIIIHTPVYGPFYSSISGNDRVIVESPMKENQGYYTIDFEDFEAKITDRTKALILCNPHNPCGRVWTGEELKKIADICLRHNLYIISDDIHGDLVYKGHPHTVIASLSEEIADRCIVCTAPSKTFNLAGMQIAHCIIKNDELRSKFMEPFEKLHIEGGNSFEEAMVIGAYDHSEQWLEELLVYLEGNVDVFVNEIHEHMPKLKVRKPEGTYLLWVDCRALGLDQKELMHLFMDRCQLHIHDGLFFGRQGEGFVRFNLACPRSLVAEALERMREVFG